MAKAQKNIRSDATKRELATNAGKTHEWPEEVGEPNEKMLQIWARNLKQRAYADWTPSDLFEIARVTRFQSEVVEQTELLEQEGYVIYGGKTGMTPMENPRMRVVMSLSSVITATMRRLGMTTISYEKKPAIKNRAAEEAELAKLIETQSSGKAVRSARDFM